MTEGFAAIPTWLIRDTDVSIYALSTYAALATYSGLGGIFPTIPTLARDARCSQRKVQDALRELVAVGALRVERRQAAHGGPTSNLYHLQPNGPLPGAQDAPGAHGAPPPAQDMHQGGARGADEVDTLQVATSEVTPLPPASGGDDWRAAARGKFPELWLRWPKKIDKKLALERWNRLMGRVTYEEARTIYAAAQRHGAIYAAWPPDAAEFIPYFAHWLSKRRWEDENDPPQRHGNTVIDRGRDAAAELARRREQRGGSR